MTKTISVVTPCFNERENVRDCYEAVRRVISQSLPGYAREHVFCDNASSDGTTEILRELAAKDPAVKVILNSRNFGPLRNTYNGVMATTGDAVLLFLPADMQDPPELIPEFVKSWEGGTEIVYGIRAQREEPFLSRAARKAYYRVIQWASSIEIPVDVGDFQLVDRKVVETMRRFDDSYPFMRMMTFECGFRAAGIKYTWRARKKGVSKNRITHLIDQGLNGLITFSGAPMRAALYVGFALSILSIVYAFVTLAINLIVHDGLASPGIPTLIVALFFFAGVQLFFIGFLGEYILAIYGQVRRRPMVVERERINFPPNSTGPG